MDYKQSVFNIEIPAKQGNILYNTYSGALILLDKPLHDYTQSSDKTILLQQGFLIDSRISEINKLIAERNRELYTTREKYLHIEIAPTMKCQAQCWYCFENTSHEKKSMSSQIAEDTVQFIKTKIDQSKCEHFSLLFFGGEPLIAIEQIIYIGKEINSYCSEHNIVFHSEIITNGIAFSSETADKLIAIINLTQVQITLDGMKKSHNQSKGIPCFEKVISNIVANAEKTNISVRLNVSRKNKDEIPQLVQYLLDEKKLDGKIRIYLARVDDLDSCDTVNDGYLDNFSFVDFRNNFIRNAIRKYKSFKLNDLLPDIKRNYCGYEKISQIMIGPEGELYRCQRTLGDPNNAVGTIYTGSFYSNNEMSYFRELDDKCLVCNLLPLCFGGCPNERRKGKPLSYCELKRLQVEKDIRTYVETLIDN